MSKDLVKPRIKIVKPRIPKFCICPFCKIKRRFRKVKEHWKTVKEINIEGAVLLGVQRVYANCLNPRCKRTSFLIRGRVLSNYWELFCRSRTRMPSWAMKGEGGAHSPFSFGSTLPKGNSLSVLGSK